MTRIIGGELGGRTLYTPPGATTRPTAERIRGAIGNALQSSGALAGAAVLDLYAGSGALGLELLSRGAASATLVESDRAALEALRRSIEALALTPRTTVIAGDVTHAVARLTGSATRFDVVVADPPYAVPNEVVGNVVRALIPILAPGADIVIERGRRTGELDWPSPLQHRRTKRYGDTLLCYGLAP